MRLPWELFLWTALLAAQQPDAISNPSAEDLARGKRLYERQCAVCHGITGTGGRGANLAQPRLRRAPDNQALFAVIQDGIEGTEMPESWQLSDREIAQVAGYVRSFGRQAAGAPKGDAPHGKTLYAAQGCSGCHVVQGQGGTLGPELTDIGARRSPDYIRQALIEPGAAAPEGFLMVTAIPRDGAQVSGMRVAEDSFTIQIRDLAGRFHSLRKSDLSELRKQPGVSPMPGYSDKLSAAEIDDLVSYLASLRGQP